MKTQQVEPALMAVHSDLRFEFLQSGHFRFTCLDIVTPTGPFLAPAPVTVCIEGECINIPTRCKPGIKNGDHTRNPPVSWESQARQGCSITVWKPGGVEMMIRQRGEPWTAWRGNDIWWEGDGYKIYLQVTRIG